MGNDIGASRGGLIFGIILVFLFLTIGTVSAQWSGDIRVTNTTINQDSRWANTISDSQGNIHIAYNERPPNGEIWYTKLDNNGNILVEEKQITVSDGGWSKCPVLAVDSNDDIHMTFCDYRTGHWEPYYVKLDNNGTNLTDETRLGFAQKSEDRNTSTWSTPAVDSNDYVHVAWTGSPDDNTTDYQTEVYYSKLYNNGTILVNKIRLTTLASHKYNTAIALDSNGDVHIVWKDRMEVDGSTEIFYTKLDNNGNTLVDDTRLTVTPKSSRRPWITIDSADNVNIVWLEGGLGAGGATDSDLYYMKLNNTGDKIIDDTRLTLSSTPVYSIISSSPMDSEDNIHIAWNENRSSVGHAEIYYMKINNTGGIIINDTRLTNYPSVKRNGIHTALDPDDNVHITWTDDRDGTNEIYYKRSLAPLTTFNITLLQGWNLISIPLEQANWSIDAVLASIDGNYTAVYVWIDGSWKWSTALFNPLTEMDLEHGYWINMTAPGTLELSGTVPASTTINISLGWNLVGYPSVTTQNLTDVLSSIGGNYTAVYAWIGGAWKWSTALFNPLTEMSPGYGYWINATDVGSYEVGN